MKHRTLTAFMTGMALTILAAGTALGAQGSWQNTASGWQYIREDGTAAAGTWEDIDGEWYHFDSSGNMQTGWQTIGNLRYYFESDGKLSSGWQHYTGEGKDLWYYYDASGNAVVRWLLDNGSWYWFNGDGTLSTATSKTIGSQKYYFHEDGSLRANEYEKFRYINEDGLLDGVGDVISWNEDHKVKKRDESTREEVAEALNELPKGWLANFVKNGWTFIYCPDDDYYSSAWDSERDERYYIYYKLNSTDKTLRFTDPQYLKKAFGEYIYLAGRTEIRELGYTDEVKGYREEVLEYTELPEYYAEDYGVVLGCLLEGYLDEADSQEMEDMMEDLWKMMGEILKVGEKSLKY